jgi:hypothetical protein
MVRLREGHQVVFPFSPPIIRAKGKDLPVFITAGFARGSTSPAITGMSGILAGDLLVAIAGSRSAGDTGSVSGATFTNRGTISNGSPSICMNVLTATAAGGETAFSGSWGVGAQHSLTVLVYRKAAFGAIGTGDAGSASNTRAFGLTCVGGGLLLECLTGVLDIPPAGLGTPTTRASFSQISGGPSGNFVDTPSVAGATGNINGGYSDGWTAIALEIVPL